MSDNYKQRLQSLILDITQQLPADTSPILREFVRHYYERTPIIDLEHWDPAESAAAAQKSYEFMTQRDDQNPKIRLLNLHEKSSRIALEVLNNDMPFLVDSLTAELTRLGFTIYRTIHPIFNVKRNAKGALESFVAAESVKQKENHYESLIHFQLSALPDDISAEQLIENLQNILHSVKLVVDDWALLVQKIKDTEESLNKDVAKIPAEERSECKAFLEWLRQKNFVFLGAIEYDFFDAKGNLDLQIVKGSELGIFRMEDSELKPQGLQALPADAMHFALVPNLMEITKSNRKSIVHRPVNMDYIAIKRFDTQGKVIGECRFLGLFTSIVYYQSAAAIPVIRQKFERILERANFDAASHDGKSLKAILEFASRDELFQISEDDLFEYALGVLSLEARPAVRLFVRRDNFERFVSCMVFIPRERFSTQLRQKIQTILENAFEGTTTSFFTQMTDSPLARAHLIIKTTPGNIPAVHVRDIEEAIAHVTNQWQDSLRESLAYAFGAQKAERLMRVYGNAFPASYVDSFKPLNAVYDIERVEQTLESNTVGLELFKSRDYDKDYLHLKIYTLHEQASLSDILPMLENFGFRVLDETPYRLKIADQKTPTIWIRDFRLLPHDGANINVAEIKQRFEEALAKCWAQDIENDGFNALVVRAGIDWRQATMLRAYAKYAKQATFPYSLEAIIRALSNYPNITHQLVQFFQLRFQPALEGSREALANDVQSTITSLLNDVKSLEEDRILRHMLELIRCTWRTNYFQTDAQGNYKSYLSFKLDSSKVPGLPLPRPFAEIFVYSNRVEGIHLRGGKVARGGLRWSDRGEDFRTEVLGLIKAQMVKNAVIVPVGSKGGFVLKKAPAPSDRDAFLKEGIACYQTFLRGLLDITDNLQKGVAIPPSQTVRYDDNDPYLVVAADKGTATFSDYANAISKEYGFWLGDAFASGGSVGYDHKVMGITARGAWVSVMRHFREMGIDTQTQDFTTVGIGDMAGDVFGNGMLQSPHIKLVAAFNHMHIFLDPNPDAAKSFAERERMFHLPRSSWEDYDASLISKGGGIFKRSEKTIPLSAEIKQVLDVQAESLSPDELIQAILKAPVDLLWNGGIGTYVKAETETHEQVGDRTNNALRINGSELRCKVIGEGGNLGFTQLGRIEYALNGGRLNTDAIDNSAGVDCSDHEVNIKIAFGQLLENGALTEEKRNQILATMTDDVAYLVLKDNHLQTQALSVVQHEGVGNLDEQERLIDGFERSGHLKRSVEFLPSTKTISDRRAQGKGLTRPELSVLLSYAKNVLYPQLLESSLPDDAFLERELFRYFPKTMQTDFAEAIKAHPLRREIIATMVTNSVVNRGGITFMHSMMEDSGMKADDIARAYIITRHVFDIPALWNDIEKLDANTPAATQAAMFRQASIFLERTAMWFLRNLPQPMQIQAVLDTYGKAVAEFMQCYTETMTPNMQAVFEEKFTRFKGMGAPDEMAQRIARLEAISSALDVVQVALDFKRPVKDVARIYFQIGALLHLGWMRRSASRMTRIETHWDRMAMQTLISQFSDHQRRLAAHLLHNIPTNADSTAMIQQWHESEQAAVARYLAFVDDVKRQANLTFPMLMISMRHLGAIGSLSQEIHAKQL